MLYFSYNILEYGYSESTILTDHKTNIDNNKKTHTPKNVENFDATAALVNKIEKSVDTTIKTKPVAFIDVFINENMSFSKR